MFVRMWGGGKCVLEVRKRPYTTVKIQHRIGVRGAGGGLPETVGVEDGFRGVQTGVHLYPLEHNGVPFHVL